MLPVPAGSEMAVGVVPFVLKPRHVMIPAPSVEHPVSTFKSAAALPMTTAFAVKAPAVCVTVPVPPPPIAAHPVAFPLARTPVGACPVEHSVGAAARAVAVAALPVVFWFHVGADPVNPEYGRLVAVMVPVPVAPNEDPVPTSIAAVVFVPEVSALKLVAAVAEAFSTPLVMLRLVPSVSGVTVVPGAA
jgi:hypothetical protein